MLVFYSKKSNKHDLPLLYNLTKQFVLNFLLMHGFSVDQGRSQQKTKDYLAFLESHLSSYCCSVFRYFFALNEQCVLVNRMSSQAVFSKLLSVYAAKEYRVFPLKS